MSYNVELPRGSFRRVIIVVRGSELVEKLLSVYLVGRDNGFYLYADLGEGFSSKATMDVLESYVLGFRVFIDRELYPSLR